MSAEAKRKRNELRHREIESKKLGDAAHQLHIFHELSPGLLWRSRNSVNQTRLDLLHQTPEGRKVLARLERVRAAHTSPVETAPVKAGYRFPTRFFSQSDPSFVVNNEQLRARFKSKMPPKETLGVQVTRGLLDSRPDIFAEKPYVTKAVTQSLLEPLRKVMDTMARTELPKNMAEFKVMRLKLARNLVAQTEILRVAIDHLEQLKKDDPEHARSYAQQARGLRITYEEVADFARRIRKPITADELKRMSAFAGEHWKGKKKRRKN